MENTPMVDLDAPPRKNVLFEVTTFSKLLAAVLFIILPFVGFWIGTKYNTENSDSAQPMITPPIDNQMQQPQNPVATDTNVATTEKLTIPEDSTWISAQTGVFKGYLSKKVLSADEVLGDLAERETITCDTFTITEGDLSIFYKNTTEDSYTSLTQNELPYEIYIGDGNIKTLPKNTQDALLTSSPTTTVYALITEYFSSAGKGLDDCESEVEIFTAI